MDCIWADDTERDASGWRWVRCVRCAGRVRSPHPHRKIHRTEGCLAWPRWHEFGEWLAILFAALYVTPSRYRWLRWKLGLDEVPETSCAGCDGRKAWLNTFGGWLSQQTHWAARWLTRLLIRPPR